MLDELARELEHRGHAFVRYADDCNIYVRSEKAGQRVMKSVSDFITRQLKLKVNESKSAVDRSSRRKFLGFTIAERAKPQRRIAPQALNRFREKVWELTRRTRGVDAKRMVSDLTVYLRGSGAYFGFCQAPWELRDLDGWIRRRLRVVAWKHWKRGSTRCRQLMRRSVSCDDAVNVAWRFHNPWRASRSIALSKALPQTLRDRQSRFLLVLLAWSGRLEARTGALRHRGLRPGLVA